jgi:hypothetical protein
MRKCILLLLMISLVFCAACGRDKASLADAVETTLGINGDGTVEEVTIEPFEAEYYSETELEAYIQAAVEAFNQANPQPMPETESGEKGEAAEPPDAITIVGVKAEHGKARMDLLYQSVDLYNAFNESDLKAMTLDRAVSSGVFSNLHMIKMAGGKGDATVDAMMQKEDLYVVITQQKRRIVTGGKLVYYTENVTEEDAYTAVTAADEPSILLFKMK